MEKNLRLQELFELAKNSKLVRTKGEFANLIGIKDQGTLSHALSGDERYSIDNLIDKAELALYRNGVLINDASVYNIAITALRETIESLKRENASKQETIDTKEKMIESLNSQIELLKKGIVPQGSVTVA